MPDQPPSGAPATSSPPAPVTPLTPVVAALIGGLVLVIVGAFVVLVAVGADPSTFVLLIGAPILTAVPPRPRTGLTTPGRWWDAGSAA